MIVFFIFSKRKDLNRFNSIRKNRHKKEEKNKAIPTSGRWKPRFNSACRKSKKGKYCTKSSHEIWDTGRKWKRLLENFQTPIIHKKRTNKRISCEKPVFLCSKCQNQYVYKKRYEAHLNKNLQMNDICPYFILTSIYFKCIWNFLDFYVCFTPLMFLFCQFMINTNLTNLDFWIENIFMN